MSFLLLLLLLQLLISLYSSSSSSFSVSAYPQHTGVSPPPVSWNRQLTIALTLLLVFSAGFATFAFIPLVRRKIFLYRSRQADRKKYRLQMQQRKQEQDEREEQDIQSHDRVVSSLLSMRVASGGLASHGLTAPQLRSVSQGTKGTRTGSETIAASSRNSSRSRSEETESLFHVRLPEQPPSIMLREVLPLPPIEFD
jgi:hypothetical protein